MMDNTTAMLVDVTGGLLKARLLSPCRDAASQPAMQIKHVFHPATDDVICRDDLVKTPAPIAAAEKQIIRHCRCFPGDITAPSHGLTERVKLNA